MSTSRHFIALPFFIGLPLGSACSVDTSKDLACGGNGEMHGSHCHCDAGFSLSDDGSTCETSMNEGATENDEGFSFNPGEVQSAVVSEGNNNIWLLEAIDNDVQLKIEIYESFGGISSPGSVSLNEDETNYATCGTCVLLQTGCELHGDHYHCSRTYMPKAGGEILIDSIGTSEGEQFNGELRGIEFQEVNIAQDYETEAVDNGALLTLPSWSFETQLEAR